MKHVSLKQQFKQTCMLNQSFSVTKMFEMVVSSTAAFGLEISGGPRSWATFMLLLFIF